MTPRVLVIIDTAYPEDLGGGVFPQRRELQRLLAYLSKFVKVELIATPAACEAGSLTAKQYREHGAALLDEIESYQPSHILMMGKGATYAMSEYFPEKIAKRRKWNKVVGRPFEMLGSRALVTLSPSVLFSDKNAENAGYMQLRTVIEHLHLLVHGSDPVQGKYELMDSKAQFRSWLKNVKKGSLVGVDIETTGLNFQRDDILTVQFSDAPYTGITVPWTLLEPEDWAATFQFLYGKHVSLTGQNFKFDAKFLMREGVDVQPWMELSVMHVIEDERPGSHNLDSMSLQLLGEEKREVDVDDFAKGNIELFSEYAAVDADLTRRCAATLSPVTLRPIFGIMQRAAWSMARLEKRGWRVDMDLLSDLIRQCDTKLASYGELFQQYGVRNQDDRLGIMRALGTTGSVDKAHLSLIGSELSEAVINARGLNKVRTGYLGRILSGVQFDGRYHADYRLAGPSTGRTSCGSGKVEPGYEWLSINMQNIPRPQETGQDDDTMESIGLRAQLRNLFIPDEGYKLIGADFSAAEFRVAAALCGDAQMILDCNNKLDTHSVIAVRAFNLPIELNLDDPSTYKSLKSQVEENYGYQRTIAKRGTFAALYGGAEGTIAANTGCSTADAGNILRALYGRYPGLKRYFDSVHEGIKRQGVVRTHYGRARRFPYASGVYGRGHKESMLREGQNYVIQSTASDYGLKALGNFDVEHGELFHPLAFVHDAIYAQAPEDQAEDAARALTQHMQNADNLNGVIMYADAKISDRWGLF